MNTFFIMGLIVLVLVPLVYRFPMLLAGYNTMSAQEREKIDKERLRRYAAGGLAVFAIVTFLFGVLPNMRWAHISYLIFTLFFVVAFITMLNSKRMKKQ